MRPSAWLISVVAPVAVVACAAWPYRPPAPALAGDLAVPPARGGDAPDLRRPIGAAGCAAAACHGGPATDALARGDAAAPDCWKTSATHWFARDPHARAYADLEGELAARIMAGMAAGGPLVRATDDARCLACHTNPALAPAGTPESLVALRREGVGCEACHGNAGGWLYEHTAWYDQRPPDATMARLNDLGERAAACAGCHVGAAPDPARGYPARDMNHDMIAAGHPRLNFDFADSQRRLTPHWFERDRAAPGGPPRGPDFEARAWLVGRVAHAEAAALLLADRAARADRGDPATPWPELAESSCVSCHHAVGGNAFPAPRQPRKPGRPQWQPVWPVTRTDDLRRLDAFAAAPPAAAGVDALLAAVQKTRPPAAALKDRAGLTAAALRDLRRELAAAPAADVTAAAGRVLAAAVEHDDFDRDAAWQVYYGLAAAERTRTRAGMPPDPAFTGVRETLLLPAGTTLRFDAPPGIAAEFKKLLK